MNSPIAPIERMDFIDSGMSYTRQVFQVLGLLGLSMLVVLVSPIVFVFSQENQTPAPTPAPKPNWDIYTADLKITSPINPSLKTGEEFFLRYSQNIDSIEDTTQIGWNITDNVGNPIYSDSVAGNRDNNQSVKITQAGIYNIALRLKIADKYLEINKKIEVVVPDISYYQGLSITETNPNLITLNNNTNKSLDTSNIYISYNNGQIVKLNQKIILPNSTAQLVTEQNVDPTSQIHLVANPVPDTIYTLQTIQPQAQTTPLTESVSEPTSVPTILNSSIIDAPTVSHTHLASAASTIRTGGNDFNLISLLPFVVLTYIFAANEELFQKTRKFSLINCLNNTARFLKDFSFTCFFLANHAQSIDFNLLNYGAVTVRFTDN
ncbi:MAG: hypothetical protein OHK0017_13540 [Patescibacteria group bacterium]